MKHKPSSGEPMPVIANDRAEIMRRLANAISEVTRKPDTVRMNSIWSCVECEAHRKQLKPEDLKKYEFEEKKLEKAKGRRKELKEAFEVARFYLQEDEAVFLSQTIRCLPDICADAWTHIDYVDDETINKMDEIASRLQFRAYTELHNKERPSKDGAGVSDSIPADLIEWEYENIKGTEKRKAGGHMASRMELAEHQRVEPDKNSFRDILANYPERKFYPTRKIQAVREAERSGNRLPSEALYDMTDWAVNWKPPSAPNWKHPGKWSEKQG